MKLIERMSIIIASSMLMNCSPQNKFSEKVNQVVKSMFTDSDLISNQPTQVSHGLYLIELQTPPLLEGVVGGNIDPERKKGILAEQAYVEGQLKSLSPEVIVIYKYKLLINAMYVFAPKSLESSIDKLAVVSRLEKSAQFTRPEFLKPNEEHEIGAEEPLEGPNSVDFIGAHVAHLKGITGKGVKVGIIDTGIDYTHKMLGGVGDALIFKNMDPAKKSDLFPNAKVLGGIDLVGTNYSAGGGSLETIIPQPDENPIDEGGHGTHVAGTVAGHGDQKLTYSGVAPDADLYAIKVFGANGSTSDGVVIAGLEYAMDPNGDLDISDKLDLVNLSLGSDYGSPQILYNKAIRNASLSKLVVVAAAGNSGHTQYIVGSPGTTDEALSVAASIDNMNHNILFDALKVNVTLGDDKKELIIEYSEAGITKKLKGFPTLKGKPVYLGLGQKDKISDEDFAKAKGNVALIDRGVIPFSEKIKLAQEAGAIAVVVANNQPGAPFIMGGGEEKFDIPAIMIAKVDGDEIKKAMAQSGNESSVIFDFKSGIKVEKPNLVDTLTDFSSRGPRSLDSAIKPEIAAPGSQIVSAAMGSGYLGVKFSGTSMATPHMAGVVALLKQQHKDLSADDFKSLVMGSAKKINDASGEVYPISLQGSGRVQIENALEQKIVSQPASISLGEFQVGQSKVVRKKLTLKNISNEILKLKVQSELAKGYKVANQFLTLNPSEVRIINLDIQVNGPEVKDNFMELDGRIQVYANDELSIQIPMMAVVVKASDIKVQSMSIAGDSASVSEGSLVSLQVINGSKANSGQALPFILLGKSDRVAAQNFQQLHKTMICDLESVGYRVVEKDIEGEVKQILQVAIKTYSPLTSWLFCEPNVQIDIDGDGKPEQELAGVFSSNVAGLGAKPFYASGLFDAHLLKSIRQQYEKDLNSDNEEVRSKAEEDYAPAIAGMMPVLQYTHSTLTVLQADVSLIAKNLNKTFKIKVGIQSYENEAIANFDFLDKWVELDLEGGLSFIGMPELIDLKPQEQKIVQFSKGKANESLIVYMPNNPFVISKTQKDYQSQIIKKPKYKVGL